ncbi:MAG: VTT domain-containing protein [Gammaproteobacteria bacterium]|nr:VTT domain-containing protein [Gammaproteobacteria bacterium]
MKVFHTKKAAWIFAILLLLALAVLLVSVPPDEWTEATKWGQTVNELGALGVLVVFIVGALTTAVGLPRQLLAFVGGFSYGVLPGLLLGLVSAICGCAITFFASRSLLRNWVLRRYPNAVSWLDNIIHDDPAYKILLLRLQPLGTNLLTNLSAGVSKISAQVFLFFSLIGYIPQMLVFSLIGSGVRVGSGAQLFVSFVMLAVSVLLGLWLMQRHTLRQKE